MCGIAGYTGRRQAELILLEGLAKLENHGCTFYSGTNTKAAVKLVDHYYKEYKLPLTQNNSIARRKRFLLTMLLLFAPYRLAPPRFTLCPCEV